MPKTKNPSKIVVKKKSAVKREKRDPMKFQSKGDNISLEEAIRRNGGKFELACTSILFDTSW